MTKTSIGGAIGGCAAGAMLRTNNGDPITISQPTPGSTVPFTFPTKLPTASYDVTLDLLSRPIRRVIDPRRASIVR